MLGLVVIREFGEFDHLFEEVLRGIDVEAGHRHSGMVRRFDLLDAIVNLSSKPFSACQPGRRARAEENHHNTDESNQREGKCAVIAKAVRTALHYIDGSRNVVSRANRYAMWTDLVFGRLLGVKRLREHTIDLLEDIDGKELLDVSCDAGRNFPFLVRRVGAGDLFPSKAGRPRCVVVASALGFTEQRQSRPLDWCPLLLKVGPGS